jgi:hypothetical protein
MLYSYCHNVPTAARNGKLNKKSRPENLFAQHSQIYLMSAFARRVVKLQNFDVIHIGKVGSF